ncbi:NADP-dependent mannitol dehydrogenase [Suillus subalutaceus]|uniref:NADP-dependent mannitol dehydrogenase n=1 Tax=Suillus subalutaceus TaxID=48586 RepID=UPI001B866EA9|nr:NADP-dependent mannitol dehydrogenase [Suillus subalutaceus]KAG1838934.1 NADP-dependent mannitol dehydrogenase [Suillus subalutaceus]
MSSPLTIDFSGKCVIVTGGNRGIGLAYSRALAKAGARVAIVYRSNPDAPKVAKELQEEYKVKVQAYKCDVTNAEQTVNTFARIDKELGPVTGLVAVSRTVSRQMMSQYDRFDHRMLGFSAVKPAFDLTTEDFNKVYGVNVLGVVQQRRGCCKVSSTMLWKGKDLKNLSIVITSSMSSQIINQASTNEPLTQVFYNSSKAAVSNLTKGLAAEWAKHNIRVNAVSPGYVETDQTRDLPRDVIDYERQHIPLGKFGRPDQISGQALFLLSEHASYMTGGEHFVDGGQLIW